MFLLPGASRAFAILLLVASCLQAAESGGLPGMPPLVNPADIYSETRPGMFSPTVRKHLERIYVPNAAGDVVDIIDPKTFKVLSTFSVGREPQHVTPSWDMKSLWVLADLGDTLTRIDPLTGQKGETL